MPRKTWTATDLADMTGRTVVVTGASSGIGVETARELARVGAHVVLAVRNVAKGEAVAATMAGETEVRELDLASLASIRTFADAWSGDLAVLINNAGIMQVPQGCTPDGFELQIGTNHLGPFALTNLLLPQITERVVTVSSQLHRLGRIRLDDLNSERRRHRSLGAYCDSKLANLWFTTELQRRLSGSGSSVRAVAAHPGVATTNLTSHSGGLSAQINVFGRYLNDAHHGALPSLYAATQDVAGGSYVGPNGIGHIRGYPDLHRPSSASRDAEGARKLWELSARLTGTGTGTGTGANPPGGSGAENGTGTGANPPGGGGGEPSESAQAETQS
jgi:NAD(P)-dependent dehydrogenase (short-subunit alcohol dehydrogenase family)